MSTRHRSMKTLDAQIKKLELAYEKAEGMPLKRQRLLKKASRLMAIKDRFLKRR